MTNSFSLFSSQHITDHANTQISSAKEAVTKFHNEMAEALEKGHRLCVPMSWAQAAFAGAGRADVWGEVLGMLNGGANEEDVLKRAEEMLLRGARSPSSSSHAAHNVTEQAKLSAWATVVQDLRMFREADARRAAR